jgi:NAD dependent epimerase/dehydratase
MNELPRKCLVTGADGFIGSHLVEDLIDSGWNVSAFVYYNSFNSWGWLDNLPHDKKKSCSVIAGDIRDTAAVRDAVRGVDVVFHLAALIGIPYSYTAPDSYVATNVTGTLNVLQAAREFGTERVLVTSTSEVYGTALTVPIAEDHPRQAQSPYAASKIAADALAESFIRSFDLPATIVRPFNTYGPRQSARAVIPTIITQLLDGNMQVSLGDLKPRRDLVYVEDTAAGFRKIAESDALIGRDCNIATGCDVTIGDLAHTIIELIEPSAEIVLDKQRVRPPKSEVMRLCGCNRRLEQTTGWKPENSLKQGLHKTIQWFRHPENRAAYKADRYNV